MKILAAFLLSLHYSYYKIVLPESRIFFQISIQLSKVCSQRTQTSHSEYKTSLNKIYFFSGWEGVDKSMVDTTL